MSLDTLEQELQADLAKAAEQGNDALEAQATRVANALIEEAKQTGSASEAARG